MFNTTTIKNSFSGLIGWRQNLDSSGIQLTGLTTSSSGLWFNDEHPLLTFDNLLSIAPDVVKLSAVPATQNTLFTDWLTQKTDAAIVGAVRDWFNRKAKKRTANNLLEKSKLFNNANSITETVDNFSSAHMVGLEIIPQISPSLKFKINKIGVQLDTNQTVTVRLFHSQASAEVANVAINYTGSGGVQWEDVSASGLWEMTKEGSYFLVYDQSAITGNAINGVPDYNFLQSGQYRYPSGKYFVASAFSIAGSKSAMWDISGNKYDQTTNYGLNVDFALSCDYTNLITEQKELFTELIMKKVALMLLREMALNPQSRVNRNEANIKVNDILYELDGDSGANRRSGIGADYESILNAVQLDTTGIDEICLPCKRRGIKIKTVGGYA